MTPLLTLDPVSRADLFKTKCDRAAVSAGGRNVRLTPKKRAGATFQAAEQVYAYSSRAEEERGGTGVDCSIWMLFPQPYFGLNGKPNAGSSFWYDPSYAARGLYRKASTPLVRSSRGESSIEVAVSRNGSFIYPRWSSFLKIYQVLVIRLGTKPPFTNRI